ncbi:FlxA-like family protein [Duganella callida]|uniref:FlxA-like protein n=1 Tax=Duganella callida TaxID=2561932 RepID=A0A4Y9T1R0_9BURK|nr:FlxA-like family protein [Duganella callida]TFW30940.1 hypothetical protein E4L98_01340 [Duganella callida]
MNVISAYRSSSATQSPSSRTETTTVRAALMKQIQGLQKQEMALGEQLNALQDDDSKEAIQKRVFLQQQISRIEEQIAALQQAMLQDNADRSIKLTRVDQPEQTEQQQQQQQQQQAAPSASQPAVGQAAEQPDGAAVGTLVDVMA